MENFIVSARKYRPLSFDGVVGQMAITNTLKNAIKNGHVAQAYLFCGPRGVGKTTCARIFAKTINCQNPGDNTEPCNECESCQAFSESRSYNIHELDAASNNSVEDIRNLNEQVRIPPQIGNYSTYIIDEVHMLSSSAFNAFLKTLEEPPAHAVFILATTEKQKIIPTILSRCQIFDFNRIKVTDMVEFMLYVADKEKITAEPEALNVIAQKADGAMRDALSIFDQIVSYSGNRISYKDVIENLNILDYDYYFRMTEALIENKLVEGLMVFNEILENGFDGHHFLTGLSAHFRDLLVCKDPVTVQLLEVGASIRDNYLTQSQCCTVEFLYKALEICSSTDIYYKNSNNQRLHVEMALMKLASITGEIKSPDDPQSADTGQAGKNDKTEESNIADAANNQRTEEKKEQEFAGEEKDETIKNTRVETGDTSSTEVMEEDNRTSYTLSTTSIKAALNGGATKGEKLKEEKPGVSDIEPGYELSESSDFDPELLITKWKEFAESIKREKPRLAITLKTRLPVKGEDYRIQVVMNNGVQKEDFDRLVKADLLEYLKRELNNDSIQLTAVVEEKEDNGNSLYTDEEKFKHLAQKNPNLTKFKQQFNLDFE